jgi:hypothetical protein
LIPLLASPKWTTRETASDALGALARVAPPTLPTQATIPPPIAPLQPAASIAAFEYDAVCAALPVLSSRAVDAVAVNAAVVAAVVDEPDYSKMSARERAKAKLLAKKAGKTASSVPAAPPVVPAKRTSDSSSLSTGVVVESDVSHWAFAGAFVQLRDWLLDARWELRHGAAIALRELFVARPHDLALRQRAVLDDLFTRILVVMSRDRFADFSGDTTVAPVRAAVATLVGAMVASLGDELRASMLPPLVTKLAQLLRAGEWQAQQGGLLALKFLCAVQAPSAEQQQRLLVLVLPALQCKWEDVRFEATETLLALVEHRTATAEQCDALLAATLPMLGRYGRFDMSGAIAGALRLVAEVIAIQHEQLRASTAGGGQIAALVWPFLLHNIAAVRLAALQTLLRLLELDASASVRDDDAMRFTFQALFFATRDEHALLALRVWKAVCAGAAAPPSPALVRALFAVLATPIGSAVDARHIVVPVSPTAVQHDLLAGEEAAHSSAPHVVTSLASTADATRATRALQCVDAMVALPLGGVGALDALIQPMLRSAASQTVALLLVGALPTLRSDATLAIVRALSRSWATVHALESDDDMAVLFEALESDAALPWHRRIAQTLAARLASSIAAPASLDALRRLGDSLAIAPSAYATLSRADAVRQYDVRCEIVADADADGAAAAAATTTADPTRGAWRQRSARLALAALLQQSSPELVSALRAVTAGATPSALLLLGAVAAYASDDVRSAVVLPRLDAVLGCVRASAEVATTALAQVCAAMPAAVAETFVTGVLTLLHDSGDAAARRGGVYSVRALMQQLSDGDAAVFVALFAPAMLTCMSDADELVRETAAPCFANLVRLMPVESSVAAEQCAAQWFSASLQQERVARRALITQLLDGASLATYTIPPGTVSATLRPYQQHGVNWLAFLRQYGMHGVLCDDMGLGKTLQTLCILAADRVEHERFVAALRAGAATAVGDSARLFGTDAQIAPSLVVCPSTLQWHWANECRQYCGGVLRPCVLTGSAAERRGILQSFRKSGNESNVLIASYEQVRGDVERLRDIQFRYAVLDEGHLIKNAKTGIASACKQIKASHRLLLSGTPVQNNVLELWSLFDFLMPGFLGSEKEFNARYSRPISATRDARRVTSAQVAAAGQALTSLHRQVLPFVLRRLKADVLSDLPPKIIQDVECDMGDVQRLLYDALKASASGPFRLAEREFCNHPRAFFDAAPPALREQVLAYIRANKLPPIDDLQHSPKATALVDLLRQCGVGGEAYGDTAVTSAHRVLIFAQSGKSLDLIARLLSAELPQCSAVRLDSSVAPEARMDLVTRFNQDPTIDVMLLTDRRSARTRPQR